MNDSHHQPRQRRFRYLISLLSIWLLGSLGCAAEDGPPAGRSGQWDAWLESPGGELRFSLSIDDSLRIEISGGEEVLKPPARLEDNELVIEFTHFDSTLRIRYDRAGDLMEGEWRKLSGPGTWSTLPFHARRASTQEPADASWPSLDSRWAVNFESSEDVAVAILNRVAADRPEIRGTILTTTGDYRYLWGRIDAAGELRLQAFDGAHAFLFLARLQEDGTLSGDFWSRDSWHETWTARPDPDVKLPDAFALTRLEETVAPGGLSYPDLDGTPRSLDDPEFSGRARIIEVFGTWCPNCYDATRYLMELDERFGDRGLSILGLAFELSGEFDRDAKQVRRYIGHHGIRYPILIAGTSDKDEASRAFPLIDRVRSYPTFLFIDRDDKVRAIYTGFSGPATGPAHDLLREEFEQLITGMLE